MARNTKAAKAAAQATPDFTVVPEKGFGTKITHDAKGWGVTITSPAKLAVAEAPTSQACIRRLKNQMGMKGQSPAQKAFDAEWRNELANVKERESA